MIETTEHSPEQAQLPGRNGHVSGLAGSAWTSRGHEEDVSPIGMMSPVDQQILLGATHRSSDTALSRTEPQLLEGMPRRITKQYA